MSILVSNIKIGLDDSDESAFAIAKKRIRVSDSEIKNISIYKKSLDARRRESISFVVSVLIELFKNESEIVKAVSDNFVVLKETKKREISFGNKPLNTPIAVIGSGPAGLWAALTLSKNGYRTIVYERGRDVDSRVLAVDKFWRTGELDTDCNVQFGEGGAGTFSDGKLVTRITDSRIADVLNTLVVHGAPKEILYTAKPHIGTDLLRKVIKNVRNEIIANGGQVHFNSKLENVTIKNGKISSITINGSQIEAENVVLAVGHSARDVFYMLAENGVMLENKSFSVGVRIEQLQSTIDKGLYGRLAGDSRLPAGEYQLSLRRGDDCVYTFCMCPGGYVVPSASQAGGVVTNGMSEHLRNGKNANSALVASVSEKDYGANLFDGVRFQESLEKSAFIHGGKDYKAPAQTIKAFFEGKKSLDIGKVHPSYAIGVKAADFNEIFSNNITNMIKLGLHSFDKRLRGFSAPDGILTGVETRTSSPVRILRSSDTLMSPSAFGLYPCGEGAGYAGGITSAAVDGIKIAERIMSLYKPF